MPDSSSDLRLFSLEIENYRQYYGKARFVFSQDPDKNFTIIKGVNGAGKTNIMNAITWCLFMKEMHLSKDDIDFPIISSRLLREKAPNGIARMSVTIELADTQGPKYRIERKLSVIRNGSGTNLVRTKFGALPEDAAPSLDEKFQYLDKNTGGWEFSQYLESEVTRLLPEALAGYFLFDGERLEEFFDTIEEVKKGIEDVSQIVVTERTLDHLEKVLSEFRKNKKGLNPQHQEIQKQIDDREKELADYKKQVEPLKQQLVQIKKDLKAKEDVLRDSPIQWVSELQRQEDVLNRSIRETTKRMNNLKNERMGLIVTTGPQAYFTPAIETALDMLNKKVKAGDMPPKFKHSYLKELLARGTCICGSDVSKGTSKRSKIENMLNARDYSQIDGLCKEVKYNLLSIQATTDQILPSLNQYDRQTKEISAAIETDVKKLNVISEKLKGIDLQKLKDAVQDKETLRQEELRLTGQIAGIERDIETSSSEREKLNRRLDREMSISYKHDFEIKRIEFSKQAHDVLERVKNELLHDVRTIVQRKTKEYFEKLIWKKKTFTDVLIDEKYDIRVEHIDQYKVLTGLSKGEKLILALSFMAALRDVTGFKFPLMIDTPLGRISGEHRHNIATSLPKFLKDVQITLLMTDTEYSSPVVDEYDKKAYPSVRETILPRVGVELKLEYNEADRTTVVKPYGNN